MVVLRLVKGKCVVENVGRITGASLVVEDFGRDHDLEGGVGWCPRVNDARVEAKNRPDWYGFAATSEIGERICTRM